MLQQEVAEDFVIATGITTSVREFVRMAFHEAGIKIALPGVVCTKKASCWPAKTKNIISRPGSGSSY